MIKKPPLQGATTEEAMKWLREPPSRLEFYQLAGVIMATSGKIVHGSLAIMREEPILALDQLQEALDGLNAAIKLMPRLDEKVLEEFQRISDEAENG